MDPVYELLAHFGRGATPEHVLSELVDHWSSSSRPRLRSFSRSGEGVEASAATLASRLLFRPNEQSVTFSLRTKRGTGADVVKLYFSNPDWNFDSPVNCCRVDFMHDKINDALVGYTIESLVNLVAAIADSGPALTVTLEASRVIYTPRFAEAKMAIARMRGTGIWPIMVHWITYLPPAAQATLPSTNSLEQAGIQVMRRLREGGLIVTTGEMPPFDPERHIDKLIAVMDALGIMPQDY